MGGRFLGQTDFIPGRGNGVSGAPRQPVRARAARGDGGGHAAPPHAPPGGGCPPTRLPSARFEVHDRGAVIDLCNRLCFVPGKEYRSNGSVLSAGAGHPVPVRCDMENLFCYQAASWPGAPATAGAAAGDAGGLVGLPPSLPSSSGSGRRRVLQLRVRADEGVRGAGRGEGVHPGLSGCMCFLRRAGGGAKDRMGGPRVRPGWLLRPPFPGRLWVCVRASPSWKGGVQGASAWSRPPRWTPHCVWSRPCRPEPRVRQ